MAFAARTHRAFLFRLDRRTGIGFRIDTPCTVMVPLDDGERPGTGGYGQMPRAGIVRHYEIAPGEERAIA